MLLQPSCGDVHRVTLGLLLITDPVKVTGYCWNANQYTQKSFEYRQCVVLAGMKLVDLHKAQANVGPHKKERIRALAGADKIKLENWTLKNQKSHHEVAAAHQQALVDDGSFFQYLVLL